MSKKKQPPEPTGFESPMVICLNCGAYMPDMGRNVACEECGDPLPTGRATWVLPDGSPYPDNFAKYWINHG